MGPPNAKRPALSNDGNGPLDDGRLAAQIFQEDQIDIEFERHLFKQRPASQHVSNLRLRQAGLENFRGQRVIEIDSDSPIECDRQIGRDRARRWRQQDSDVTLIVAQHMPAQQTPEDKCARE